MALTDEDRLVIEGPALQNLIDDLIRWEEIEKEWYDHIGTERWKNWKRSPIMRENRRESIVYGNCLETIKGKLGRRQIARLMEKQKDNKNSVVLLSGEQRD